MGRPRTTTPERRRELGRARSQRCRDRKFAARAEQAAAEIGDLLHEAGELGAWDVENPREVAKALLKHRAAILKKIGGD